MTDFRPAPKHASVTEPIDGDRLHAPAAARNAQAITDVVCRYAPARGTALEIASGTGQHIARWGDHLPDLSWQPTEVDPLKRASIDKWTANSANIAAAQHLDATELGWSAQHPNRDLIVLVNLLHLISTPEARILLREAADALAPGGRFIIYGPFLRDGQATSEGDARFHASLRADDPEIGYKDLSDVRQWLADTGLTLLACVDMPANNLSLIYEQPTEAQSCPD